MLLPLGRCGQDRVRWGSLAFSLIVEKNPSVRFLVHLLCVDEEVEFERPSFENVSVIVIPPFFRIDDQKLVEIRAHFKRSVSVWRTPLEGSDETLKRTCIFGRKCTIWSQRKKTSNFVLGGA